jgi:serine/threonine protein kinase
MLARFYEEGRRTGRLNHPNIVIVYDLGDDNGTPYIVMERVQPASRWTS